MWSVKTRFNVLTCRVPEGENHKQTEISPRRSHEEHAHLDIMVCDRSLTFSHAHPKSSFPINQTLQTLTKQLYIQKIPDP